MELEQDRLNLDEIDYEKGEFGQFFMKLCKYLSLLVSFIMECIKFVANCMSDNTIFWVFIVFAGFVSLIFDENAMIY
jgi:hypothetical protein